MPTSLFLFAAVLASGSAVAFHSSSISSFEFRSTASKTLNMSYTFYGWLDQCPTGSYVRYPRPGSKTQQAQGDGNYSSPITFAGTTKESDAWYVPPHTKVYIHTLRKYFVMEDACEECGSSKPYTMDLWMGPSTYSKGLIECEDNITPDRSHKVEVIVAPPQGLPVDTTPFYDGETCIKPVDPKNKCTPNKPVTKGCNTCQLNWDDVPADGSGQKAYPKEGLTCNELAKIFESSVARLKELNPGWDCGDGSKKIPYSDKNFCQGDSCGEP